MIFDDGSTVDAMVTVPKICEVQATVAAVRGLLRDNHVHAALIVDSGTLVAVIDRTDLRPDLDTDSSAAQAGRLLGRVIAPDVPLQRAHQLMLDTGRRRLAVVDDDGALLGGSASSATVKGSAPTPTWARGRPIRRDLYRLSGPAVTPDQQDGALGVDDTHRALA